MLVYLSETSGRNGERDAVYSSLGYFLLLQCVPILPGVSAYVFLGCVASIFRTCLQAPEWVLGLPPLTV